MPIQRITRDGETYYRWGDSGKLYRNRSDAEKQAQAAYASGYKKKESKSESDDKAEVAGRRVAKDIEYDDKRSGTKEPARMRDRRAEAAGRKVTKDMEYDMRNRRR